MYFPFTPLPCLLSPSVSEGHDEMVLKRMKSVQVWNKGDGVKGNPGLVEENSVLKRRLSSLFTIYKQLQDHWWMIDEKSVM